MLSKSYLGTTLQHGKFTFPAIGNLRGCYTTSTLGFRDPPIGFFFCFLFFMASSYTKLTEQSDSTTKVEKEKKHGQKGEERN